MKSLLDEQVLKTKDSTNNPTLAQRRRLALLQLALKLGAAQTLTALDLQRRDQQLGIDGNHDRNALGLAIDANLGLTDDPRGPQIEQCPPDITGFERLPDLDLYKREELLWPADRRVADQLE